MKLGKISAVVLSAALFATPTMAADNAATPLPAGKPAGTHEAALNVPTVPLLIIAGSLALALAAGLGAFDNSTASTASTGTSS